MKHFVKNTLIIVALIYSFNLSAQINNGTNTLGGSSSSSGGSNTVSGTYSFTNGQSNNVTGAYSAALGISNTVGGTYSNALGYLNNASGSFSFAAPWGAKAQNTASSALGYYADANANYSVAIGRNSKTTGTSSVAVGYYSETSALYALSLGMFVKASSNSAITIGSGINTTTKLDNNITNTLMVGFNSTIPTLFVGASSGAGTTGNVGIATTSPVSALTVAPGAVGTTSIGGQSFNLGITAQTTSNRSGFVAYPTNDYLDGAGNNGHFVALFPYNDNANNDDLSWKAFRLQTGASLVDKFWIDKNGNSYFEGNMGIGTTDTQGYKFAVKGDMIAEEIVVKLYANWPDYVFGEKYNLKSLEDVEEFINENNHLPNVPSEAQVKEDGINLGEMDAILLQKIEELTLYTINQQKLIEEQGRLIEELKKSKTNLKD